MKKFYTFLSHIPFLVLLSLSSFTGIKAQNIYLVDAAKPGNLVATPVTIVDAAAWNNAAGSLQIALNAATTSGGGQIWVRAGTYKPSDYPNGCSNCSTERDKTFLLRNNIAIYGGFAGTESLLSQRSISTNPTILSGDMGIVNDFSDNSYHTLITVNSDSTAVLDGFTIMGGNANGAGSITIMGQNSRRNSGSGMLNNSLSSPSILNCTFVNGGSVSNVNRCLPGITNCNFTSGAGISNDSSCHSTITNCNFTNNSSGMFNNLSSPNIINCSFANNSSVCIDNEISNPSITNCNFTNNNGLGIQNYGSTPSITNCTFTNNSSGGINNSFASPNVTNCTFTNSRIENGSNTSPRISNCIFTNSEYGMLNMRNSNARVTNCIFVNNRTGMNNLFGFPIVINCVFANNSIGMYNNTSNPSVANSVFTNDSIGMYNDLGKPKVANCSFVNNSTYGVYTDRISSAGGPSTTITNCIIWGNGTNNSASGIYHPPYELPVVTYNIIQGGYPGTGNLDTDPLFKNAANPAGADSLFGTADDGLQLQPCSPAINMGSNTALTTSLANSTSDITGTLRIYNDVIDLGAYEYQGPNLAANGDNAIALITPGITTPFTTECHLIIASLQSMGTSPVSGNVTARIWVDSVQFSSNSQTYVKRHYEITPATNPSIATGRITLYALQPEFDDFNNYGNNTNLPTSPADAVGIARLRIIKFSGQSSNGTGLPSTYTQPGMEINPADSNIVWNNGLQRWEITFDVTGFSGFFISDAASSILPLTLLNFEAKASTTSSALLGWRTALEINTAYFELQRSTDNYNFLPITKVQAKGTAQSEAAYGYTDKGLQSGLYYYRLRMVDKDGKEKYSNVVTLNFKAQHTITIYPVPSKEIIWLSGGAASLTGNNALLMDMQGRVLQTIRIQQWPQPVNISSLAIGHYLIKLPGETTVKLIKQ